MIQSFFLEYATAPPTTTTVATAATIHGHLLDVATGSCS